MQVRILPGALKNYSIFQCKHQVRPAGENLLDDFLMMSKTKEPLKREYSAGGVVYKRLENKKKVEWLVVQPAADDDPRRRNRWQLPKGWIDPGETGSVAAAREVKEEGGVVAEVVEKIGEIRVFFYDENKQKVLKTVAFFLMEYQSGSEKDHDSEISQAVWLPFEKAYGRLTFKSERETLEKAKLILKEKEKQPKLF